MYSVWHEYRWIDWEEVYRYRYTDFSWLKPIFVSVKIYLCPPMPIITNEKVCYILLKLRSLWRITGTVSTSTEKCNKGGTSGSYLPILFQLKRLNIICIFAYALEKKIMRLPSYNTTFRNWWHLYIPDSIDHWFISVSLEQVNTKIHLSFLKTCQIGK